MSVKWKNSRWGTFWNGAVFNTFWQIDVKLVIVWQPNIPSLTPSLSLSLSLSLEGRETQAVTGELTLNKWKYLDNPYENVGWFVQAWFTGERLKIGMCTGVPGFVL